jgi:hypothetical protein
MTEVEVVRDLGDSISTTRAQQCVVRRTLEDGTTEFYVVSSVVASDTGKFETLAFRCPDDTGKRWDSTAWAGGIGRTREEIIEELRTDDLSENANLEEWSNELGGPMNAIASTLDLIRDNALRGGA